MSKTPMTRKQKELAVLRGRAHLYEGVSADRAVFGIRVLGKLGVRTLVVTNATLESSVSDAR